MRAPANAHIPRVTADLISAAAELAQLDRLPIRARCRLVQLIADQGVSVDHLTVGQLIELGRKARRLEALLTPAAQGLNHPIQQEETA